MAVLSSHQARADCAMPVGYQITEAPAGEVQICLRELAAAFATLAEALPAS